AVMLVAWRPRFFENLKKMHRPVIILLLAKHPGEEYKAHHVMRVGDRESLGPPKNSSSGGDKRLAKNHRCNRQSSQKRLSVVERLGAASPITSEEALVIVGRLAIAVEPLRKPLHH